MKLEGKSLLGDFFKFIIPSVVAQWVFTLYTMIDGIFVARGVSEIALTAVNISAPFTVVLFSISILFAVGNSTVVAIQLGTGQKENANRAFSQNLVFLAILSLLLTGLVLFNLEHVAHFLGATASNMEYVCTYIGTIASFAIFFILSYSFEMLIKTDGHPKKAMVIVTTGAVLNCILDYLMIMVWNWGVFGAAFATGLSQAIVCILYILHFLGKRSSLSFTRFRWTPSLFIREIQNGASSGLIEFSSGFYVFLFNQMILLHLSEDALVSFTIIGYMNALIVMSMAGISQGSQPLISYYYGKNEEKKCRKLLKYGLGASLVLAIAFAAVSFLGTDWLISLFISPEHTALREYSVSVFRIFALSFLIVGFNIVIGGYFTSKEEALKAITLSLGRGFILITISIFLLTALFGGAGIWWAPLLSEATCLIIAIAFLLWKKNTCQGRNVDSTKL